MQGTMQLVVKCNVVFDANEVRYLHGTAITPRYNVIIYPKIYDISAWEVRDSCSFFICVTCFLHMIKGNIYSICGSGEQKQKD